MAKICLQCEQCGGNIILDNAHEIGTCESCFSQFVIKHDQIVQKITQNITKYVYGYQGKDIEELLEDGYRLVDLDNECFANEKFKRAIEIDPNSWAAWHGLAISGGERDGYLSFLPAFRRAYVLAKTEEQETATFNEMIRYVPDRYLRSVFVRAFNLASGNERTNIFDLVSRVIGRDESEIASLALDLCPDDWRGYFVMTKFRQIRTQWCALEGNFITGKHLPQHAQQVMNFLIKAYRLAEKESIEARKTVETYINSLNEEPAYKVFSAQLRKNLQ